MKRNSEKCGLSTLKRKSIQPDGKNVRAVGNGVSIDDVMFEGRHRTSGMFLAKALCKCLNIQHFHAVALDVQRYYIHFFAHPFGDYLPACTDC